MAKGILNIQAADGAVIGLHVPDGLGSGDRALSFGPNLSGITAYHLLQGNLAVSNYTITQGFNTTLYTGNGSTQTITTGIDMSTQWGNDASETFGGLVWGKSRSSVVSHMLFDTIRGANNRINTDTTNAASATTNAFNSFNSNGFTVGSTAGYINDNAATYASWNFQTTHRVTGTTNHGKAYTCHYNPFTGFTMVKYEGSGIAGHEIPHMLGRKLGFVIHKNLSATSDWHSSYGEQPCLVLNTTVATGGTYGNIGTIDENNYTIAFNGAPLSNVSGNTFIIYGWANSYFDKANKLIGNYEIGVYQGTGVAGNKITTRGKPAWIMIKRLDGTSNWDIYDNQRSATKLFRANQSVAEATYQVFDIVNDGFIINYNVTDTDFNASGGQYLYLVAYDTNANGGGSYYPLASDTANVQVNNALIPIAQGIDSNGAKNTILSKNETFSGVTYTQGKNYPYYDALGNRGVSNKAPNYGLTNPANGGDFYNVLSNKWFTSAGTEITNGRNYLNHIVYADNDGSPLYVEELPKIEYKDIVKANEFKGKNACTAWVNFDGTTTPPTIRDSYNVSSVVRTGTGIYEVYFATPMDNTNWSSSVLCNGAGGTGAFAMSAPSVTNKQNILVYDTNMALTNAGHIQFSSFGGKN